MDSLTESRSRRGLFVFLAGLEAGMIGALFLLAWMGLIAKWQVRSFWAPENLMASVFYGASAVRRGFAGSTASGLALYLLIYSLLGALFAVAVQTRLPRFRLTLVSVVFALTWYYLFFHVIGKSAAPLVFLLHPEKSTILGHGIFGVMLARYPVYLSQGKAPPAPPEPPPTTETPMPEESRENLVPPPHAGM